MKHCETCTCGMIAVQWSDREGFVDPTSAQDVASMVMSCALDHSYDRTRDGIPHGLPDEISKKLAPIVAAHLVAVEPDWKNKTVYMGDEQRNSFKKALVSALSSPRPAIEEKAE